MRTTYRRVVLPTVVGACTLALSACGGDKGDPEPRTEPDLTPLHCAVPDGPVAIAASARTGTPVPAVTGKVATVIDHLIDSEGHLTLVDTDGAPSVLEDASMTLQSKNDLARKKERELLGQRIAARLSTATAGDRQADPLSALDLAARSVHSRSSVGTVVLVDSGLQTSGALRYQSDGSVLASGSELAQHLRAAHQLPDLSGTTVLLVGLGDTTKPQPRTDTATRGRLVEQWTAIAEAAGAACVEVDTQPLTKAASGRLPAVTRVTFPKPSPPKLPHHRQAAIPLREDTVGFLDDSDQLRDPAAAEAALKPLANDIVTGRYRVLLVGTTATAGTEAGRKRLSMLRAEAVRRIFVDLGVPSGRITTRGVGIHYPKHVDDLDANGALIPARAVKNRAVFVTVRKG